MFDMCKGLIIVIIIGGPKTCQDFFLEIFSFDIASFLAINATQPLLPHVGLTFKTVNNISNSFFPPDFIQRLSYVMGSFPLNVGQVNLGFPFHRSSIAIGFLFHSELVYEVSFSSVEELVPL